MVIIDCHNDLDAALDEYLRYKELDWDLREKFMQFFQAIHDEADCPIAEMKVPD